MDFRDKLNDCFFAQYLKIIVTITKLLVTM